MENKDVHQNFTMFVLARTSHSVESVKSGFSVAVHALKNEQNQSGLSVFEGNRLTWYIGTSEIFIATLSQTEELDEAMSPVGELSFYQDSLIRFRNNTRYIESILGSVLQFCETQFILEPHQEISNKIWVDIILRKLSLK